MRTASRPSGNRPSVPARTRPANAALRRAYGRRSTTVTPETTVEPVCPDRYRSPATRARPAEENVDRQRHRTARRGPLQGLRPSSPGSRGAPALRHPARAARRRHDRRRHRRLVRGAPRRDLRRHGAVRIGQVHADPHAQRPARRDRRHHPDRRRRAHGRLALAVAADPPRAGVDGLPARSPTTSPTPSSCAASPATSASRKRARSSASSASPAGATSSPPSCRAA
jgi:hypothetical protein